MHSLAQLDIKALLCTCLLYTSTREDQINEIGDLLYHLTVLMVEKGISMEDVSAELKRRAQKTHNLKAERKPIEHL